jgi:hypothetical protein
MASSNTIRACLRLLSGAFPRGGFAFGGELKPEACAAWESVFGGDHILDETLRAAVNDTLLSEKAPTLHAINAQIMGHKRSGALEDRRGQGCEDCGHSGMRTLYAVMREERHNGTCRDRWHTEALRCDCTLGRAMFGGEGPDVHLARRYYASQKLAKGVQMAGCAWFAISPELDYVRMQRFRREVLQRRGPAVMSFDKRPRTALEVLEEAHAEPHALEQHADRLRQHEGLEGDALASRLHAEKERMRARSLHRAGEPQREDYR